MIYEKIRERLQKARNQVKDNCEFRSQTKCINYSECSVCIVDYAIDIVNQVETEYNNGWIPCSEKLPEDGENVLLCINGYEIQTGYRTNTRDGECFYMHKSEDYATLGDVIAWQPLPEPYTPRVDIKGE